ncbi:HNH endonuclease [Nocardia brasiliensis]|uniref:HNH endonuclease n=1 Tax=Nocardia brasiliensis TaxID=37326 RepID=UPI0024540E1F|nr:HNH endonuclease [Nocardia brasiliensis]
MAISKRVRYEVLRRDNFTCRYCGGSTPEVTLTVDHVIPVALGGGDDPSNLVAACKDCNAGKSSAAPDSTMVADISAKAVQWSAAMKRAADERLTRWSERQEFDAWFLGIWKSWTYGGPNGDKYTVAIPSAFGQSLVQLMAAGLERHDFEELVEVAMTAKTNDTWKYFCGCCWRRIRQAQERAQQIVGVDPVGEAVRLFELADYDVPDLWVVVTQQWELSGRGDFAPCACDDGKYCGDIACLWNHTLAAARELAEDLYSAARANAPDPKESADGT